MAINFNNVSYSNKLKDINCTFEKNKITFLIGSSGSGKTLMSYLMTGLIIPNYGNITVLDNTIDSSVKDFSNIRRNIGYVFQDPSTSFFTTSVRKEIEFGLRKYEYKLDSIDNRVINSLKIVGLPNDYLDISPFELSSGEKEKLAIAISLSLNPKILILDEPTIYLDDKSKNELVTLLKKLKDSFSNKTGNYESVYNELENADVLLIDDIGAENNTMWARDEVLGSLLQSRMDNEKITFFTSNFNLNELENHLSETSSSSDKIKARRIIERIKQLTKDIELVGENRRN